MADTTPVFLKRSGLIPAPELRATCRAGGLDRTTTVFGQHAWLVSRAEDVRTVLSDATLFTSGDSMPVPEGADKIDNLLLMDPPQHTALRRMLAPAFTARALRRLEPRVRQIVADQLDQMSAAGPPADLVASFSWEIPSQAICELLGVPAADRARLRELIDRSFDFSLGEERLRALTTLTGYIATLAERAQAAPAEDVFGMLVREHGGELGERDLIGIGVTLLQAGHETTAAMITSAVFMLLTAPGQLELLRNEPRWIGSAIEELLRYLAVVQISPPRRATRDTIIGGQPIAAGELLLVSLPAANHDPGLVDEPGRLDITRGAPHHLAFGHGIHHCLGAPLARMELEIALPALFGRFPDLALAIDPEHADYTSGTVVHGLKTLPVTW